MEENKSEQNTEISEQEKAEEESGEKLRQEIANRTPEEQQKIDEETKRKRKKNRRTTFLIALLLLVVGIPILCVGIVYLKNSVSVEATITNIIEYVNDQNEISRQIYVDYSYNGKNYNNIKLSYSSDSYEIGQSISIKIDKTNPEKTRPTTLLVVLGGFFSLIGLVFLILALKKPKVLPDWMINFRRYAKEYQGTIIYAQKLKNRMAKLDPEYQIIFKYKDELGTTKYVTKSIYSYFTESVKYLKKKKTVPIFVYNNYFSVDLPSVNVTNYDFKAAIKADLSFSTQPIDPYMLSDLGGNEL